MPIVKRYPAISLDKERVPYPWHVAPITRYNDEVIMLFRSHRRNGRSILGLARSKDGLNFSVDPEPFMVPSTEEPFAEYEEYGVEDPRITLIDGEYLITYSAYSRHGVRIGLAKTSDWKQVERVSLITQADYRNTVIFPRNSMACMPVSIVPTPKSVPGPCG